MSRKKNTQSDTGGNLQELLGCADNLRQTLLYSLKVAMPCQRFLPSGKPCGRDATEAIVYDRGDYKIVIPMCRKHLPRWAKNIIEEVGKK